MEYNGKWISVNDRLPNCYQSVIACDINGYVFEAWIDKDNEWLFSNNEDVLSLRDVTYWTVFPTPPKQ